MERKEGKRVAWAAGLRHGDGRLLRKTKEEEASFLEVSRQMFEKEPVLNI